jgi:hypothetical protein
VKTATLHKIVLLARLVMPGHHPDPMENLAYLLRWSRDPEQFLDLLNAVLQVTAVSDDDVRALDRILEQGDSIWRATERGIELRVDATVTAAFEEATAQADAVSEQLAEAWTQAYGRQPDPSDVWDHAIKAVEATLIPIACQNNAKATLSNVIGELSSQSHRWKLLIRGKARDHSVASLVGMLQLIWPDPNRHGSSAPEPPATIEEARAVVHLAVTIVQWGRDGLIVKR